MENMEDNYREVNPPLNFYLNFLEEQVRCALMDSEARLTQGKSEERVSLEIREDSLTDLLEQLQGKKKDNWSQEKELLQREMCRLKAQLDEARAETVHSSQSDTETLQYKLKKTRKILRRVRNDLEQQTSNTQELQLKLEAVQRENEAFQNEAEAMKLEVRVEKQLRAVAEQNVETSAHCLRVQLFEKDTAEFEARSKAEELEKDLAFEKAQTEKLQKRLSEMKEALLKQKEDAKKTVERSQAYRQTQLREHTAETGRIKAALKTAEDLLETERLRFQQEKNSFLEETEKSRALYVSQIDQLKMENSNLVAPLKKADQQLENERIQWQVVKSSLLQVTDKLTKTLQEKEQEWETTESCIRARLEAIESQIAKSRKKWYKRFF